MPNYKCHSIVVFYDGKDVDFSASGNAKQKATEKIPEHVARNIENLEVDALNPKEAFEEVLKILAVQLKENGDDVGYVRPNNDDWWVGSGGLHEVTLNLTEGDSNMMLKDVKKTAASGGGVKDMKARLRVLATEI